MKPKPSSIIIPEWYPPELKTAIKSKVEALIAEEIAKLPKVDKIVLAVTEHCKMTLDEILVKTKERKVVYPRQLLHYFLMHYSGLSYTEVGLLKAPYYAGQDVQHSSKTITDLLTNNEKVIADCDAIREVILK